MIKMAPRKFRHTFVMKYTAGKVLRTFAASKSPDQIPIEVNTETSFDFPGHWTWLKMNNLILLVQSKNKQRKKTKYLRIKLSCPFESPDPVPEEVNRKGGSLLPCSGLCCHVTEGPLLLFASYYGHSLYKSCSLLSFSLCTLSAKDA